MKYFLLILSLYSFQTFAIKKYYPEEHHEIFCLKSGPELLEAFDDHSGWNDYAAILAVAWAAHESGWGRFKKNYYRKEKNHCYWGFMKKEKSTSCSEKTLEDGVISFLDFLQIPHSETKRGKVKYRAKHCAPYRRLTKEFKNEGSFLKMWNANQLNQYLRSSNYAALPEEEYIQLGDILGEGKKAKSGEAPCAYNSVDENYGKKILATLKTIKGICPQIYRDIYSKASSEFFHEMISNYENLRRIEEFWGRLTREY